MGVIYITRQDKQVRVEVASPIPNTDKYWSFSFFWNCNDEVYAALLANQLNKAMQDKLQKTREVAYNQGWADAKAKRAKRTWFYNWW